MTISDCLAILIAASSACATASAQTRHPTAIPVDLRVSFIPPAVIAEGERHFVYELHVTNFGNAEVSLSRVEVLNGETGTVLESYGGDSLQTILSRPGSPDLPDKRKIAGGLRAVVFIDVRGPEKRLVPRTLKHRVTFAPITPPNGPTQSVVEGAPITMQRVKTRAFGPGQRVSGSIGFGGIPDMRSGRSSLGY